MPEKVETQGDLARALGVSQSMLSLILSGQRGLTWHRAKRIGAYVNVHPAVIMDASPAQLRRLLGEPDGEA